MSKYTFAFQMVVIYPPLTAITLANLVQTFPVVADQMYKKIRMNLVSVFVKKLPLFRQVSGMSGENNFLEVMPSEMFFFGQEFDWAISELYCYEDMICD